MEKIDICVPESISGQRIDRFLADILDGQSRSYLQKLVKEGRVLVQGKSVRANYKVVSGESITVEIPDMEEPDVCPENIPLSILYEDEDLLVVDKPKGMVVHPSAGHYSGTLVNALMYHCAGKLSGINGVLELFIG